MGGKKQKFYAVARGNNPGLYTEWFGLKGAEIQIKGFPGAQYKGFPTEAEAVAWLAERGVKGSPVGKAAVAKTATASGGVRAVKKGSRPAGRKGGASAGPGPNKTIAGIPERSPDPDRVVVYTDGSSMGNPGPGGWGVVRLTAEGREDLSGGYKKTTNNRMELMACIEGLKGLAKETTVRLYSDSQYVVNAVTKGWAEKWRANRWMRNRSERAENSDLWAELLDLLFDLDVEFVWVRGHAGNPGNERCDQLATTAAQGGNLPEDPGYPPKSGAAQQSFL